MNVTVSQIQNLPELELKVDMSLNFEEADKSHPGMTRTRMNRIMNLYIALLGKYQVRLPGAPESLTKVMLDWAMGTYYGKIAPQKELFYRVLILPENVRKAVDVLPNVVKTLLKTCLTSLIISRKAIQTFVNSDAETYSRRISANSVSELPVNAEYVESFFSIQSASFQNEYMTIDPAWRDSIAEALLPETGKGVVATTDVLPEGETLIITSHEDEILPSLGKIRNTGEMNPVVRPTQPSTNIKVTDAKTLSAGLKLTTVFPEKDDYYRNFMEKVLWSFCSRTANEPPIKADSNVEWFKKKVLQPDGMTYFKYVTLALPFFDRLYGAYFDGLSPKMFVEPVWRLLVKYATPGKDASASDAWLYGSSFVEAVRANFPKDNPYAIRIDFVGTYMTYNDAAMSRLTPANVINDYTIPLIYGIVTLYLALGLVEVAFSPEIFKRKDLLSAIRFLRLTDLGRYVFGRDSEFKSESPVTEEKHEEYVTEISTDKLMVFTTDPQIAEVLGKEFGKRVTVGRYLIDENTFRKKCNSLHALQAKVKSFKNLLGIKKLPDLWTDFFDNICRRFTAITASDLEYWRYYEIKEGSDELFDYMRTNEDIRSLVRMVEGGGFLVRKADINELRKLLREGGFALPTPINPPRYYGYY